MDSLPESHRLKQALQQYLDLPPEKKSRLKKPSFGSYTPRMATHLPTRKLEPTPPLPTHPLTLGSPNITFSNTTSPTDAEIQASFPLGTWARAFTDASLYKDTNPPRAGIGLWLQFQPSPDQDEHPEELSFPADPSWPTSDLELWGIRKALTTLNWKIQTTGNIMKPVNLIILTDSKDSLDRLQASLSNHPRHGSALISDIQRNMLDLIEANPTRMIAFQWVKAHQPDGHGVKGNEKADQLAKTGSTLPTTHLPMPYNILKRHIKAAGQAEWENIWQNSTGCKDLHHHCSKFNPKDSLWDLSVADQHIIIMLQLNSFPTNQWLHMINRRENANCPCGQLETVKHLLINCHLTHRARRFCWHWRNPTYAKSLYGSKDQLLHTTRFLNCIDRS